MVAFEWLLSLLRNVFMVFENLFWSPGISQMAIVDGSSTIPYLPTDL